MAPPERILSPQNSGREGRGTERGKEVTIFVVVKVFALGGHNQPLSSILWQDQEREAAEDRGCCMQGWGDDPHS